jgi:ADP-heptose:LPS heptosyltransferase
VRILAIRLARFGDIVLLLPALTLIKTRLPDSHLTFLTDARWGPLAAMCPAIDEVMTIDRIGMRDGSLWRSAPKIWQLLRDLRRQRFDAVIDCHGFRETNLLTWWTRAPQRLGLRRFDQSFFPFCFNLPPVLEDKNLHVSEMFLRVARTFAPSSIEASTQPQLIIPEDELQWTKENLPAQPYAVMYVGAPVPERRWPLDRFAILADHFVAKLGASVVIVGGSGHLSGKFPPGVRVLTDLAIPRLAATIASARVLVSNDTGPMHLGPALEIPTVGIFSVGLPVHFRPTGVRDRYVRGNPIEEVDVEEVMRLASELWIASDR